MFICSGEYTLSGYELRSSKELEAAIEKKRKQLKMHERRAIEIEYEIRKLRNTLSDARYKEELERNPVVVNIVSVKPESVMSTAMYLVTTDEGISWLTRYKLKLGKHKITKDQYEFFKETKERRERGEFDK